LQGLALLGILTAISYAVSLTPGLSAIVLDRDRIQLETKLAALQEAGDWPAVATLIANRLERRASREWRDVLCQRLYDSLVAAGTAANREEAARFFRRALQVAQEHSLNPDLAAVNLDRLDLRHAYDSERQTNLDFAQKDLQHQAELKRVGTRATDTQRENAKLHVQISTRLAELQQLHRDLAKAQGEVAKALNDRARATFAMLIEWADSLDSTNPLRKAKYDAARALADRHRLDASLLTLHMAEWQRILANARPIDLPNGTRAVILRIDATSTPPLTVVDLAVYLPTGQTMPSLALKDFRLRTASRIENPLFIAGLTTHSQPIQVILLLDYSNSTAGPPMSAAVSGTAALLQQLQGIAAVKLMAFATQITTLADWTDDPASLSRRLQELPPGGNTALQQAIAQAIRDLQSRAGPKAIVMFTDGRDTVGGPTVPELTALCQKHGIAIHAVALETPDLDSDVLNQFTKATGGTLLPTAKVAELPQRFRDVATALRRPFYRLVFAASQPTEPSEIVIGGTNAIHIPAKETPSQP
jgi:Mg-chelatase subunit ChlD